MKAKKALKITGFKLEKRKDKKTNLIKADNIPILVDFKFDGQRIVHPVGYRIDASKWNESEQRVKRNNFNKDGIGANIINTRINNIENQLPIIYNNLVEANKQITGKLIIESLTKFLMVKENQYVKPVIEEKSENEHSVLYYLQKFIDSESEVKQWADGTKLKMNTFKKHLEGYAPKLKFEEITEEFLTSLIIFNAKTLKLNNASNQKEMKLFKWFLNWATKKKYNNTLDYKLLEYKFKGLESKDKQQNIIFLTWDELIHLYNFDLSYLKRLEQIRDIYCFCCLTSLRYSDIENLKKSDIKTDDDGTIYIEITTIKTETKIKIPLIKKAIDLLDKYKDIDIKGGRAFPTPSNQKYNSYLKDVMKLVGFKNKETVIDYIGNKRKEQMYEKWELITSHTARKTFIIIAINKLEMSPDIVRTMTGHSDWEAMKPYIKTEWELTKASMKKFNEL